MTFNVIRIEIKSERKGSRFAPDIAKKETRHIRRSPGAKPSRPSEMLTAFVNETITNAAKGIYRIPRGTCPKKCR